jgi:hypothetical protein
MLAHSFTVERTCRADRRRAGDGTTDRVVARPATEASERVCGSPKQADARSLSDDGSGMQIAGKVATLERSFSGRLQRRQRLAHQPLLAQPRRRGLAT